MLGEIFRNIITKKPSLPYPEGFRLSTGEEAVIVSLREKVHSVFGRSLRIRQVDAGSCNACEWECIALTNPVHDIQRFDIDFVASPRHADALIDCAIDGGIYKGSYAVTGGVSKVIPVHCYIPGCPPTPVQLIAGLIKLLDSLTK